MLPSLPPLPTCPLLTELLCTETTILQPLLVSVEEGPLGLVSSALASKDGGFPRGGLLEGGARPGGL